MFFFEHRERCAASFDYEAKCDDDCERRALEDAVERLEAENRKDLKRIEELEAHYIDKLKFLAFIASQTVVDEELRGCIEGIMEEAAAFLPIKWQRVGNNIEVSRAK